MTRRALALLLFACVPEAAPAPLQPASAPTPPSSPPPPTFHLAAYRDGLLGLQRLGAPLLLVGGPALARIGGDGQLTPIRDPVPPELARKELRTGYFGTGFTYGGLWPDQAWLIVHNFDKRVDESDRLFQRKLGRWIAHDAALGGREWRYRAVFPWREGQVLGLRVGQVTLLELERKAMSEGTAPPFVPLQGFDRLGDVVAPAWPSLATELWPITGGAAPDGALFLLAHRGDPQLGRVAVQRWDPAHPEQPDGVVDELPGRALAEHLVVGAADRVFVAGARRDRDRPWLVRFDGRTWSEEPVPEGIRFHDLALAGDGALWAITDLEVPERGAVAATRLSRRRPGRDWERIDVADVTLPASVAWDYDAGGDPRRCGLDRPGTYAVQPQRLAFGEAGDLWLTGALDLTLCSGHEVHVLLRDRPRTAAPARLPGEQHLLAAALDDAPAVPFSSACRTRSPLAVLSTLSEQTPSDAAVPELEQLVRDDPAVLADLRGIYEFEHGGERIVGAFVDPAITPARTQALLAAFDRAAPGEPHGLTCGRPPIRRAFDRTTGKPVTLDAAPAGARSP